MSTTPEEPVQGHTGLQILPAERNRKMTAQQLSRSATFQKIAAADKERPGLGAGRDDSGRLDRQIPFWKTLGRDRGRKTVAREERGGEGRCFREIMTQEGLSEEKEPRRRHPTPDPTAQSNGDRDQVQFEGFQLLCAPCEMFGNMKPVLEGTLRPVRTPG